MQGKISGRAPADRQLEELYRTVDLQDFSALLDVARYEQRSGAFDKMIGATHAHYWNPLDSRYLDLSVQFDIEGTPLIPDWMIGSLQTPYVSERLSDPKERIRFINTSVYYSFSNMLHGEQGALSLSTSLCRLFRDQAAQEYAANQAREEARHVTAFSEYIRNRWGTPAPCGPALQSLLDEIISSNQVYKKIIGMQILVEGLAMGVFAEYYHNIEDPVARQLLKLVMTDESFHHKFGKTWAERTIGGLEGHELLEIEEWTAGCFEKIYRNLVTPDQQASLYRSFDLDLERVMAEWQAMMTDEVRWRDQQRPTNIFRVLIRFLLNSGLITARTRGFYSKLVDLEGLISEEEVELGDSIAADGLQFLQMVNGDA